MSSKRRKLKQSAKKRLFRRFMIIMLSTFVVGAGLVLGGIGTYQHLTKDGNFFQGFTKLSDDKKKTEKEEEKLKTNVAVFGVDKDGYRTDTIFVVHFDGERNSADLVSVPRDTMVRFSDSEYERIRSINRGTPRTIKLNEMTAYAGMNNIKQYTVKEIERVLGISIDNYITIEIDAFRKIVDIIGGVEVDVPMRMKYTDKSQGLYIDLQPGLQTLDGAAAEGLVRYREGYAEGDVGRIKTQQLFLKAFAQQLLSSENISNFPKMIPTIFQHVKTDINILDVPKYYGYASSFDVEAIKFHTIPGKPLYQNRLWYYVADINEMDDFVQGIFYKKPEISENNQEIAGVVEDKTVNIEILNGGAPAGTAGSVRELLQNNDYSVSSIGNYSGEYQTTTRIYAKDKLKAEQFKKYFPNSTILENSSLGAGIDIQIVIGSDGI